MMRFLSATFACCLLLTGSACAQNGPATAPPSAKGGAKSNNVGSYGIGLNVGRGMKEDGLEVDLDAFVQGLRDGLQAAKPRYSEEQLRDALTALQHDMQSKRQQQQNVAGDKNQRDGQTFLAANKNKPGVKSTASGLQYQVIRSGAGAMPKATDTVRVHYEGTLLDGTVFDSSIKRKEPAEFPVNGVIPGWTEALQLMKVGDKWRLFIPSELAYGPRGAGGVIGPNSVLVFEVELLEVRPAQGR
jgi:FKBP-type peptidyl-prolyl cis-trans isomerase FklB